MKFGCCDTCLHQDDPMVCDECDDAKNFEFDESLIEIGEDGRMQVRRELVA